VVADRRVAAKAKLVVVLPPGAPIGRPWGIR